jgi:hypothetical protein
MTHRLAFASSVSLALALAVAATSAGAQTWEYRSYRKSNGAYGGENYVKGTIVVEEKDGKSFFHINAGTLDACFRGEHPALVTRTEDTTIVEPQINLAGCEKFRYVIRNDGSGGKRETWRGEQWVANKLDHGLTPVK